MPLKPPNSQNKMTNTSIETVTTKADAAEMDELLWLVLWKPVGLPRDVRRTFSIEGEEIELVAKQDGRIIGGLVAVWTGDSEIELRHLAVIYDAQNLGIGRRLVAELVRLVSAKGYCRIKTIARNTSAGFFRQLGFRTAPGRAPKHPAFARHGITFELMERIIEPAGAGDE